MQKLNPALEEFLVFPARLIWLGWRITGSVCENDSTFFSALNATKDEFRAELSKGSRFTFALIGSIGIYVLIVLRILRGLW